MSRGLLSDYFTGVMYKRLAAVEVDRLRSNQHEFNGNPGFKRLLGTAPRRELAATFLYLDDERRVSGPGRLTWYDARAAHPTRTEHHLYYTPNEVVPLARAGDGFFLALRPDDEVLVIIAPAGSSVLAQLFWLFDMDRTGALELETRDLSTSPVEAGFLARMVLEELGIEAEGPGEERFDALVEQFGLAFPSTRVFSEFARNSLGDLDPRDDPDGVLMAWIEREEQLFRRLERRIVSERLSEGFHADGKVDVDGFLGFSLGVQNRRKSRAGAALENHVEVVFQAFGLDVERGARTENNNRPDFLFPGAAAYHDPRVPAERLLMLGSKTTCKDRWRQVLSEAARIEHKHLLTLEPGISESQTTEMRDKRLQLVLPASIHASYRPSQRPDLSSLRDFICVALERQETGGGDRLLL